jgi:hypothetical protein
VVKPYLKFQERSSIEEILAETLKVRKEKGEF